jgi:phage tail-like protein
MEREETQYNEGGYSYTTKLPGRERADDVTFRKGIANNDTNQAMLRWFQMISPEIGGSTANYSKFRKQILVVLQDRFGSVVNSWLLEEAWIKRYEAPELDGSSTEVAVEAMVVACEYIHTQM